MNAVEMMMKTMLDKALANLPPEIMATIGQIGQTVAGFKAQLDRIENQQRLILDHLKIPDDGVTTREIDHERRTLSD